MFKAQKEVSTMHEDHLLRTLRGTDQSEEGL